jgi:hypothetical protein
MSDINVNLFNCMSQLDQGVERVETSIRNIASQLEHPLSSAEYHQLFAELDQALKPVQKLRDEARTLNECGTKLLARLDKLEDGCPALFGEIFTLGVDREVVEITLEAADLQNSLEQGNMLAVAQKVNALKTHISAFMHDNCPSTKNLTLISSAERVIRTVEGFLENPQLDPMSEELLMELGGIAELYESGHPLASHRKERLSSNLQRRLEALKQELAEHLDLSSETLYFLALRALALELTHGRGDALARVDRYCADLEMLETQEATSPSWNDTSLGA